MTNRKARLLFVRRHQPFRVSNSTWLIIFNRSGDTVACKRKTRKVKWGWNL
jgi:hypothetical protein